MASIRIQAFAGLLPELNSRLKPTSNAQVAHNCLLTDGSLRPQAKWIQQQEYYAAHEASIRGIAYDKGSDTAVMYASFDPVTLSGPPFAEQTTVGASPDSIVNRYITGVGLDAKTVAVYSDGVAGSVSYERSYDSIKPVNRLYAVTRVRRIGERAEEGALIPLTGQDPSAILYEGDLVTVTLNASALDDGANYIRLYRSISGLDTGQAVANELDTEWYLVDEMPLVAGSVVTYTDGASATAIPLDINYSQRFHPPTLVARYFGLTETGHFVAVSLGGDIQISERFMHHAWPTDNDMSVQGETIQDIAIHDDNIYIGTTLRPYIVAVSAGDKAVQAAAQPYGEVMPCLPNSMAASASGAVYASGAGLVALGREGMQMLTRGVANAGDILYSKKVSNGVATAKIDNTSSGTYFGGKYIGFCEGPPIDDGVYYTTTLYPVEFRDDLFASGEFSDGRAMGITVDYMFSAGDFLSGSLRDVLQTYVMPEDEDGRPVPAGLHIISSGDFVSGNLPTILITYTMVPEELGTVGALVSGTLITILVTTTMVPEELGTTGALIGGTLA